MRWALLPAACALVAGLAIWACAGAADRPGKPAAATSRAAKAPPSRGKTMVDPTALLRGEASARCAVAKELGTRGDDAALAALVEALDARDEVVRDCVRAALAANPAAVPFVVAEGERRDAALASALHGSDAKATSDATFAFGQHLRRAAGLADPRLLALVDLGLLPRQPRFVRSGAAWLLGGQAPTPAALERVGRALDDAEKDVRWTAADGLVRAARTADKAQREAIAALVRRRGTADVDAGVRGKLEQLAGLVGLALSR